MKKLKLGDRMKFYERQYSGQQLLSLIPVCARIDGRAFHTFCAGLPRPFDERLSKLMVETTRYLVEETGANIGYTQSDEISLIWVQESLEREIFFDSKVLKMTSILAAMTTAYFNRHMPTYIPERTSYLPVFDARVWNVPTNSEATNYLVWRELDATRNSVSMAAQSMFSHKQLHKKSSSMMQEMMFATHNVKWSDYPVAFKRGTYLQSKIVERPFTVEEKSKLHKMHHIHKNPDLTIKRQDVSVLEIPPITKIENRQEVLLNGAAFVSKT